MEIFSGKKLGMIPKKNKTHPFGFENNNPERWEKILDC